MNEERKENQNDSDEGGVSIREIFGVIGKKIWFVLLGTILVTLAAVLIFMFALNPAKQSKSMSFKIKYPFSSELKYPDGSLFDYREIISEEVIAAAKENEDYKEEFASLDVKKIVREEGVTISAKQTSEELDAPYVYTVTLNGSYFNGVKTEHFIKALTDAFKTEVIAVKAGSLDYTLDKTVFKGASYKDQLAFLSEQKTTILNQYSNWISEYNEGYGVQGKSLSAYRTEVKTKLADKDKNVIEENLTMKGYEYFNASVNETEIKERIKQLQIELEFDKAILKELANYNDDTTITDSNGDTTIIVGDNSELLYYIKRAQTIEQQISYLIGKTNLKGTDIDKITEEELSKADFSSMVDEIKKFATEGNNSLESQFEGLKDSAETLTKVIREIYENNIRVTFEANSASSSGGTSVLIVGVVVFVVAFVVFAAIAYFVGRKGGKEKKTTNAPASEEPLEKTDDADKSE